MARDRPISVLHPLSPALVFFEVLGGIAIDVKLGEQWFGEDWPLRGAAMTLTGVLGAIYIVWSWRGRSVRARSWAFMFRGPEAVFVFISFAVSLSLGLGLVEFVGLPKEIIFPFGAFSLFVLVSLVVGKLYLPRWWGPRWYHRGEFRENASPDEVPWDPMSTMERAYENSPKELSVEKAQRDFGQGAAPMTSWQGGWVHDPDATSQEHDIGRKGTIEGMLGYYPHGLVFAASRREDGLRDEPTVVTIPREEILDVAVVSPRAGPHGRQRRGFFFRSPFSRLVIHTPVRPYVFDIGWGKAKQAAKFLKKQVNQLS